MFEEMISPLLTTEWGRRVGLLFLVLFGISLLITVVTMPFTWQDDYELAHSQTNKVPPVPHFANQTAVLIKQIPKQHLFGHPPLSTDAIPLTSLQLRLVGVVKSYPANASRVIISEAGQPGKVYQVGDALVGGVKVSAIVADGVILDNGGHLEKLPLERAPLVFQAPAQTSLLGE